MNNFKSVSWEIICIGLNPEKAKLWSFMAILSHYLALYADPINFEPTWLA